MPAKVNTVDPRMTGTLHGADCALKFAVTTIDARGEQTLATAGAGTYTAAIVKAGGFLARDCAGAGRTDTTDTAANIISACNLDADGEWVEMVVYNDSDAAEAITLAGGTGVTVLAVEGAADLVIDQAASAVLRFIRTSATTVLCLATKFHA